MNKGLLEKSLMYLCMDISQWSMVAGLSVDFHVTVNADTYEPRQIIEFRVSLNTLCRTSTHLPVSSVGSRDLQGPGILNIKQFCLWTNLKDHRYRKSMHFGLSCQLIIEIRCTCIAVLLLVLVPKKSTVKGRVSYCDSNMFYTSARVIIFTDRIVHLILSN